MPSPRTSPNGPFEYLWTFGIAAHVVLYVVVYISVTTICVVDGGDLITRHMASTVKTLNK